MIDRSRGGLLFRAGRAAAFAFWSAFAAGCPSLGPVPIACETDAHCPVPMRCAEDRWCTSSALPGANDDGGTLDAGSGGPVDGGTDAGADAGADAGTEPDAGPPPGFCAALSPAPFFCDDFDDGSGVLDDRWTRTMPHLATLEVVQGAAASAPAALFARVDVGATGPGAMATFTDERGAVMARRLLRAHVRVEALDPAGHRAVILRNVLGSEAVYLALHSGGSELYEHRAAQVPQLQLPSLPMNVWTKVELDLHIAPPSSRVTVRFDDVEVLTDHPLGLQSSPGTAGTAEVGLFVNGTTNVETRVRFDDVVFDVTP